MKLYEKSGDSINVYELKELKDKIFEYRRKEMEKMNKDEIVYKVLSNNKEELSLFLDSNKYDGSKFITKDNRFFMHKNGLKLKNYNYAWENKVIIDGLLYEICSGYLGLFNKEKIVVSSEKDNSNQDKIFIPMTYDIKVNKKKKLFDGEFYCFELPNLVSVPESIQLLHMLLERDYFDLMDKDIDEQLALYEFVDKPVAKLDFDTINYFEQNIDRYLYGEGLEVSQNILKKVRQINR